MTELLHPLEPAMSYFNPPLRLFATLTVLLAVSVSYAWSDQPQDSERPNIVLIMADDLGLGDVRGHVRTQQKKSPMGHVPHCPPDEFDGKKIKGATPSQHLDMILDLDQQVRRMVEALKANGQYENTLIIFTSDNDGLQNNATRICRDL